MQRPRRILLVCSGNTCRSPMAERLLRREAEAAGLAVEAVSAGLFAAEGAPASRGAREALSRRGVDASDHRSRPLTAELVDEADLVLTMTREQKRELLARFPLAVGKVYTLAEYAERERWSELLDRARRLAEAAAALRQRLAEIEAQLADMDVPDPYGGDEHAYEDCARRIEELVRALVARLRTGSEPAPGAGETGGR